MKREATRILKQLEESPHVGVGSYAKALTCVGMGETNKAVEWLEQALLERDFQLVLLNVDRRLDGLRGDSRFQLISKRMGLFAETSRPG